MAESEKKGRKEKEEDWLADERRKKREEDRKKFRSLSLGGKIQYFWDYHKMVLVIILVIIVAAYEGVGIYKRARTDTLLTVALMNSFYGQQVTDSICDLFEEELGAGKWESVEIDSSMVLDLDNSMSQTNMAAQVKLMALNETRSLDVIIFPERNLDWLMRQGALKPLEDAVDEEQIEALGLEKVMGYEQVVSEPDQYGNVEFTDDLEKEHLYALNMGNDNVLYSSEVFIGEDDLLVGFGFGSDKMETGLEFIGFLENLSASDILYDSGK